MSKLFRSSVTPGQTLLGVQNYGRVWQRWVGQQVPFRGSSRWFPRCCNALTLLSPGFFHVLVSSPREVPRGGCAWLCHGPIKQSPENV